MPSTNLPTSVADARLDSLLGEGDLHLPVGLLDDLVLIEAVLELHVGFGTAFAPTSVTLDTCPSMAVEVRLALLFRAAAQTVHAVEGHFAEAEDQS